MRAATGGASRVGARASAKACVGDAQQATQIARMTRENVREAALMVRGLSSRAGGAVNGNPAAAPRTRPGPGARKGGRCPRPPVGAGGIHRAYRWEYRM